MTTDTISDFLTRVQNAIVRKKESVEIPQTKMIVEIAGILKEEGMINGFEVKDGVVSIVLGYEDGESKLTKLVRVSKPGSRIYVTKGEILPVMNGRGISVVSTSKGVMTGAKAKNLKLGGELICEIW